MLKKLFVHIGILLLGALTVAGCTISPITDPSLNAQTETDAPITLKVGVLPYLSNSILQIAKEEGYFTEQDLNVEFVELATTNELIPLMLRNDIDVGTPALNAGFFNAIAAGSNLKLALPLTDFRVQECASIGYMVRKEDAEAGIYAEPSQWKDAKIALSLSGLQGTGGFVLNQTLAQNGLSMDDVQLEKVDVPAQEEALRSGQVDIVYTVEPWLTRMQAAGDLVLLQAAEPFAPNLLSSFIAFGAKPLENPEIGQRFATAYLKAVRQYLEGNTLRNVELVAKYTGLDPELVSQICWSYSPPDGAVNIDSLMDYQLWLQDQALLDRMLEPEEFFDSSFAEEANRVLGEAAP